MLTFRDHDHDEGEDDAMFRAVISYLVQAYCTGREIPHDCRAIVVHAHEQGTPADRLLTLHIATGPTSAARLALQATVSDVASSMFPATADGGHR